LLFDYCIFVNMKWMLLFLLIVPFFSWGQDTITNTDHYRITVVKDGRTYVIDKHTVFVSSTEPYVYIYWSQYNSNVNVRNVFKIDFNDVDDPVSVSASDLKSQINAFIYDPISSGSQPAPIPNDSLANSTISGVSLGDTLFPLLTGWGIYEGLSPNKYNGSDTLTLYLDSSEVATVYDASLKLDKADTATMLANYMLYGDTASMLAPYLKEVDTLSLSNRIDAKGTGTVTSVATGNGLTGGTITTTGTLKTDTADGDTRTTTHYQLRTTDSVGTVVSGVWNATTVGIGYGGTGATTDSTARLNLGVATTNDAITLLGAPTFKTKTLSRNFTDITQAGTVSSGLVIYIALDQVPSGTVLTGAKIYIAAGLSGTVLSTGNCRIGLATYSGGTYTMVDSTANDSTLFKGTTAGFTGANFVTPYTTSGETSLFAVILYKTGGTSTTFTIGTTPSFTNAAVGTGLFTNSAKVYATLAGQSFMPSSQAASGLTSQQAMTWIGIY
jgi:hypothetical protein